MNRRPFPPFKGMADAFAQIEGPISRLYKLTKLQKLVADLVEEDGHPEFKDQCCEGLVTLTDEIAEASDCLLDLWLHLYNGSCDDEMNREVARSSGGSR